MSPRTGSPDHHIARRLGAATLLALFGAASAVAQEPGSIITDRPDQTESSFSVPGGFVQVELGWTYALEETSSNEIRTHSLPQALVRVGLGGGVEARAGFSGFVSEDESFGSVGGADAERSGAGDASLAVKVEVARWSGGAQLALLGGITVPIGEEGFSSERVDPSIKVLFSNPVGERVSFGYNVGLVWVTEPVGVVLDNRVPAGEGLRRTSAARTARVGSLSSHLDTQLQLPYTFSIGLSLAERLGAFVESFGAFGLSDERSDVHSLDGGFVFGLSDGVQLDTSAGVGLNEAAADWFIGAGFSVRLPR